MCLSPELVTLRVIVRIDSDVTIWYIGSFTVKCQQNTNDAQ